jgi:hypothetical protein
MQSTAISQFKTIVCDKATESINLRQQIDALRWFLESLPEVKRIKSTRDADGRRTVGKKALKSFRRPETSNERQRLHRDKRWVGQEARIALLIYGMLRGRAYWTLEASCQPGNEPSVYLLNTRLFDVFPDLRGKLPNTAIKEWLEGGPAPMFFSEVAA